MKLCYFTWCQGELKMVLHVSFMAFFRLQGLSKPLGIMKHIFTGSVFVSMYGLVSNKVLKTWFVPCSGGGPNTEFRTFTFKMFLK